MGPAAAFLITTAGSLPRINKGLTDSRFVPDDVAAQSKNIISWSEPDPNGGRLCHSYGLTPVPILVLTYKQVTLPFTMPVALPINFQN